ncbi:MAG: NFYB/HAP3 family transcription factor subunit [Candidatus Aenigmarchaeota archaeon]|nr:NFYB/HAP3 family transcription factor subunit [Candidatus Aenigmarchaeota archaeon]
MAKIPLATFERILKETSNNIRVSEGATKEFTLAVGEISKELAADAEELARHAGRRTILDSDVKLAYKKFNK